MKLCIRVDDLGWTDQESANPPAKTADVGLELAQKFHAAMQGRPYLGAVIPAAIDDDGRAWLASKPDGLTIALHGWSHDSGGGAFSEFHRDDTDAVREKIAKGQQRIFGKESENWTRHFVAPFNAYTPTLLDAMWHEGIRYAWGGTAPNTRAPSSWPTPPQPFEVGRMLFVPSWDPLYSATYWRMSAGAEPLMDVLPGVIDLPGKAVLTLHLPWELSKGGPSFGGVSDLVDRYGHAMISAEEYLA